MAAQPDGPGALPESVEQYVDGMKAHNWAAVRASLSQRFERIGPFPEQQFNDPEVYTQFLAALLPTLEGHTIEVTRVHTIGDVSYVTICEGLRRDGTDVQSFVLLACDLGPDGRITRIEAFLRRAV
jgi:hypothetical protein